MLYIAFKIFFIAVAIVLIAWMHQKVYEERHLIYFTLTPAIDDEGKVINWTLGLGCAWGLLLVAFNFPLTLFIQAGVVLLGVAIYLCLGIILAVCEMRLGYILLDRQYKRVYGD